MHRNYKIAAVAVLAVAVLAVARSHHQGPGHRPVPTAVQTGEPVPAGRSAAGTPPAVPVEVSETVSGLPTGKQAVELSEEALAAVNHAQLARLAINDGYLDSAKKLLRESRTLLHKVKQADRPVTVTAEVKSGGKTLAEEHGRKVLNLIPIAADVDVIEAFAAPNNGSPAANSAAAPAAANAPDTPAAAKPSDAARASAIAQAGEQMRNGDARAASESLRLVDLRLIARQVSMPLTETLAEVDRAIALLDAGQLHEANLALKQVQEGLVVSIAEFGEPGPPAASAPAPAATTAPAAAK